MEGESEKHLKRYEPGSNLLFWRIYERYRPVRGFKICIFWLFSFHCSFECFRGDFATPKRVSMATGTMYAALHALYCNLLSFFSGGGAKTSILVVKTSVLPGSGQNATLSEKQLSICGRLPS